MAKAETLANVWGIIRSSWPTWCRDLEQDPDGRRVFLGRLADLPDFELVSVALQTANTRETLFPNDNLLAILRNACLKLAAENARARERAANEAEHNRILLEDLSSTQDRLQQLHATVKDHATRESLTRLLDKMRKASADRTGLPQKPLDTHKRS